MKVVHLTSSHPADDVRIFRKECISLAKCGHDVTLVARGAVGFEPGPIRFVPARFPTSKLRRLSMGAFRVFRTGLRQKGAVYHIHDPELLPSVLALKILRRKVIYDAHEDLPRQILGKRWLPGGLRQTVALGAHILEKISLSVLDGIVCATPAIARRFPKRKTVVVQNFPLKEEICNGTVLRYSERPNAVMFAGVLSDVRGAVEMILAIDKVSGFDDLRLHIAGKFSSKKIARQAASLSGWRRVDHHGWLTRDKMSELFGTCRAGLLVFHPVPNHVEAQPNKLFEYMAAGLPVIASDFPLWREILEGAGCGILVNPLNPAEIAEAIDFILANPKESEEMGRRGRHAVETRYNWDSEARKLIEFYARFMK